MGFMDQVKADLHIFTDDGEVASIQTTVGTTITPRVIFDDQYINPQTGGIELGTSDPRFECEVSQLQSVEKGCQVTIRGKIYFVEEIHPDGTGWATVILSHDYN